MAEVLKVRATKGLDAGAFVGFYDNHKVREGDTFVLKNRREFSSKWMEPIDWDPSAKPQPVVPPPVTEVKVEDAPKAIVEVIAEPQVTIEQKDREPEVVEAEVRKETPEEARARRARERRQARANQET